MTCELCHSEYSEEWVKWATENKLRVNPGDPTQFDQQVIQFNRKYHYAKMSLGLFIVALILCILLESIQYTFSMVIDINVFRLIFLFALCLMLSVLIYWRLFLVKMTKEQMNINLSV